MINADGVDPEGARCGARAEVREGGEEVACYAEGLVVDFDGDRVFMIPPYVGKSFIVTILAEFLVYKRALNWLMAEVWLEHEYSDAPLSRQWSIFKRFIRSLF